MVNGEMMVSGVRERVPRTLLTLRKIVPLTKNLTLALMIPLRRHLASRARQLGWWARNQTFSTTPYARSSAEVSEAADYCRDVVRNHDYEAFLTSQLYP